ncbi:MAG: cytochrome C biogenesis protein [Rhodobiaceae bacterium]|nr:MAG: cytochrome C biogenesis protein [Rhodobiaceae bacterium]
MDGVDAGFVAALIGGIISFLSPCVLPLVPAYLSFVAGASLDELTDQTDEPGNDVRLRVLIGSLAFVAGFSTVFIMLGATAGAVSPFLLAHKVILGQIAGAIIMLLGLHYVGLFRIALLNRDTRFLPSFGPDASSGFMARIAMPYIVGVAFAFGWTPCIGPILATILAIAASYESLGEGVALLAVYSAGLGIPFVIAALAVSGFLRFSARFRRHLPKVEFAAGGLLIATGVLMALGSLETIAIFLIEVFPWLAELG